MPVRNIAVSWSGGKDSALALSRLLAREDTHVDRLVTTVDAGESESTVHGVPIDVLGAQAAALGLRIQTVPMHGDGLDGYVHAMTVAARSMRDDGVDAVAFGDLDSSGARVHRLGLFEPLGLEVLEPLAGLTPRACLEEFSRSGLRAVVVVVDAGVLGRDDVGSALDPDFLDRLPAGADPCGELGEYHTFVHGGPIFTTELDVSLGPPHRVERTIGTTEGPRRFAYWHATPRLDS